jgi:transcriptional regulator with XRE-family HTH domain
VAHGPTIPRRRLRSELRTAREAAGLTQDQVAESLDWSTSKVIRIEAGVVGLSTVDLRALLDLYHVDSSAHEDLMSMARMSRRRTWWTAIKDEGISRQHRMVIGFEAETTAIHHFHPLVMPGLLQTEAYADALSREAAHPPMDPDTIRSRTEIRMKRQRETLLRPDPPRFIAFMDEGVLRRPVGGAGVMREQLLHLVELGRMPHVTIRIIPLAAGVHPGLVHGGFAIMQFENTADNDIAYFETGPGDIVLVDQPNDIAVYWEIIELLQKKALDASATAELITDLAERSR